MKQKRGDVDLSCSPRYRVVQPWLTALSEHACGHPFCGQKSTGKVSQSGSAAEKKEITLKFQVRMRGGKV